MPHSHMRLLTVIACMAVFLAQLGMMMYLPALPSIAQSLSATQSLTSLSLPVYLGGMAVPMLLWGKWGATWGIKPVLIGSLLMFSLGSALLAVCEQIETFMSLRFVQGLGASGMSVMARSLVAQHFKGDQLAKVLSWLSIAFVVSLGIGQYAGAILMSTFGWPAIFWCLTLAATLLAGLVHCGLSNVRQTPYAPVCWGHYLTIVRHAPFLRCALIGGLGYAIIIGFNTAAPSIFQTTYRWSASDYGVLGWAMSLAYLLGSLTVNRHVLIRGQSQLSAIATGLMVVASLVMLLAVITSPTCAALLWLPYCLIVFCQAISYPISLSQASDHSPVSGPYSMALCGFIHQLVAAFAGVTVSLLNVQNPLYLAAICLLLAAGVRGLSAFNPSERRANHRSR
ncbi:MFS transporter [Pseudomonas psychrophila]|uniref:MFS transporter n=1 Tax=Pseudomonas psychrophila TaxID=122355 RepID=UPI0003581254|nr:MFS transporter [Pseudomonas psychrophila]EPJ94739.1 major facilitator transporter [Pseudomonas psychrophila]